MSNILGIVDIKSQNVETVYTLYSKNQLLINRKYQRKLVWTVEEKEKFIDSLHKGLPIPLILTAVTKYKENEVYEIIDGMQRLNAIVSFIENEVRFCDKYFNLETFAYTKKLKDDKSLKQKEPMLDIEDCLKITSYPIPFSITPYNNEIDIEEIFRRINSYGKTLSSHELRQAGAMSTYSRIVRKIAESIRGDVSPADVILLNNMRNISINNKGLRYGINIRDIFWNKHNILTDNNIRASRDEELIAHLLLAILMNNDINISSTSLDRAYGVSDDSSNNIDIEKLIKEKGGEAFVIKQFEAIYNEICKVLSCGNDTFRELLFKNESKYLNYAYQIIYLAFYKLLVIKEMKIADYKGLNKTLSGLGDSIISPSISEIRHRSARKRCIDSVVGVIEKEFLKRGKTDPALSNGTITLIALINAAKAENTSYDFKQGIFQLDKKEKNIIPKIVETLSAFVNQGKSSMGYVILGVADKSSTAEACKSLYGCDIEKKDDFYITGIDAEAKYRGLSIDQYMLKLKDYIKAQDIKPEYYKTQILQNVDLFTYNDKSIIKLRIESVDQPLKLNGKFFHRQSSSTEVVPADNEMYIYSLFIK